MIDGDPLPDEAVVTILAREGDETFEMMRQWKPSCLSLLAEADRSETVSAEEVLRALRNPK